MTGSNSLDHMVITIYIHVYISANHYLIITSSLHHYPQEPATPTGRTSLSEEELANLESVPHEEIVAMMLKQRQVALRYKGRFTEVK